MKVVVVGARGYLGGHLLRQLESSGETAVPLTRANDDGIFRDLATGREATLTQHCDGADAVVNLAGELVHDPKAGIRRYFEANVAFADDLARAAVEAQAGVVVHASSRLVYPADLNGFADEERDASPDTPYGLSKLWGEDATRVATKGTATSALSLRIGQVTGGDHPGLGVINRFISQARDGLPLTVNGEGKAVRDIVHVDDVAQAIVAALCYRGAWTAVNVAGVSPVSIIEIAHDVARITGAKPVQHAEVVNEDVSNYGLVSERSRDVLGWNATTTLTEIIAENWARAQEATK